MNKYWNISDAAEYNVTKRINGTVLGDSPIPYLITQMKIQRTLKPHPFGRRSKYIVRPEAVVMAGNHIVHKFADGEYIVQTGTESSNLFSSM